MFACCELFRAANTCDQKEMGKHSRCTSVHITRYCNTTERSFLNRNIRWSQLTRRLSCTTTDCLQLLALYALGRTAASSPGCQHSQPLNLRSRNVVGDSTAAALQERTSIRLQASSHMWQQGNNQNAHQYQHTAKSSRYQSTCRKCHMDGLLPSELLQNVCSRYP